MVFESFIDSSDVGEGEFTTRLRFRAPIWPWGYDEPVVERPDGSMIDWRELSERDQGAIRELIVARVAEARALHEDFHEERVALETKKRWGA